MAQEDKRSVGAVLRDSFVSCKDCTEARQTRLRLACKVAIGEITVDQAMDAYGGLVGACTLILAFNPPDPEQNPTLCGIVQARGNEDAAVPVSPPPLRLILGGNE